MKNKIFSDALKTYLALKEKRKEYKEMFRHERLICRTLRSIFGKNYLENEDAKKTLKKLCQEYRCTFEEQENIRKEIAKIENVILEKLANYTNQDFSKIKNDALLRIRYFEDYSKMMESNIHKILTGEQKK